MKTTEKTTENARKTLDLHHRGIPNEDLPLLFQEVVSLARRLNSYLWIDSVCIIQDSPEDKKDEISKMSDIFRGALVMVVVVAATAKSPSDSLLRVKPQDQSHTWRTASLVGYQEMEFDVKFRKRASHAHSWTDATWHTTIAQRAWCFQEKLLASHCLVFCRDEVVLECQSCCLCECGGEQEHFSGGEMEPYRQMLLPLAEHDTLAAFAQLPFTEHEPFLDGSLTTFAELPFAEHEPLHLDGPLRYFADAEAAYSFWETAVKTYSGRALSEKGDRLPAISAVASIVAEAIGDPTGDSYLAGLWRDDLLTGLCWAALHDSPDDPRPHQKYIAPTWSWASHPSWVWYPQSDRTRQRDANLDASVLDAWTVLEGQNPCGPVSDGAIVLSALHCDAELTISNNDGHRQSLKLDFGHAEVQKLKYFYYVVDWMCVEPDPNVDRLGGNSRYLRHATDQSQEKQPDCSGTVRLLWLREGICLILTPSHRKKGAYERLGISRKWMYAREHDSFIKMPQTVQRLQRSSITLV